MLPSLALSDWIDGILSLTLPQPSLPQGTKRWRNRFCGELMSLVIDK